MEAANGKRFARKLKLLLLFTLSLLQAEVLVIANAEAVVDSDVRAIMTALRNSDFFTAANVISYVKAYLVPRTTLLVPSDSAIFNVGLAGGVPLQSFPSLLKLHVVQGNLSFHDLRLFPVKSWLPTALQNSYVQITKSSYNTDTVYLSNARIIKPDMCPKTAAFLVCHGIDAVLGFSQKGPPSGGGEGRVAPAPQPVSPLPVPTPSTPPVPAGAIAPGKGPTPSSSSDFTNPYVLFPRRAVAPTPGALVLGNATGGGAPSLSSGAECMLQQHAMRFRNVAIAAAVCLAASRALF